MPQSCALGQRSTLLPNTGDTNYPNSATPDGQMLVIQHIAPDTASDLYAIA